MTIDARNQSLAESFTRIRTRQIALPRFQPIEAWTHANVAQFFKRLCTTEDGSN